LALVLLIGAALLIRSFVGLRSVDPGLDPRNVFTFQTSLAGGAYSTTASVSNLTTQVVRRVEMLPGVEAAASTIALPVENGIDLPFTIVGKPPEKGEYNGDEQWRSVSPHYFQVFKIPLLRGRAFAETDTASSTRAVIINDAMAKKYWPKEDALGQMIVIGKGLGPQFEEPPRQIVGIVGNVRENGLGNAGVGVMYVPQSQMTEGHDPRDPRCRAGSAARVRPDPTAREPAVRCESQRSVRLCRRRRRSDDGCPRRDLHPREAGDGYRSRQCAEVRIAPACAGKSKQPKKEMLTMTLHYGRVSPGMRFRGRGMIVPAGTTRESSTQLVASTLAPNCSRAGDSSGVGM